MKVVASELCFYGNTRIIYEYGHISDMAAMIAIITRFLHKVSQDLDDK